MFPILIALIVFVIAGLAGTAAARRLVPQVGDGGLAQGLAYFAQLRWRDFAKLVLHALQARDFVVVRKQDGPADGLPSDGGDILLDHAGTRTLLSCRGTSASLGIPVFEALAKSARLHGAGEVMVAMPGTADEETRRLARLHRMELLDGPALWPQVRDGIDPASLPVQPAPPADPRRTVLPWLAAAVLAALAWWGARAMGNAGSAPEAAPVAARAAQAPAAPAAPVQQEPIPTDPAALESRRTETANAVSTVPGVARALWSTQSTLLVYLQREDSDPLADLCPLLERYPELAASRVQLQPPAGSDKPVRWRQCRAY